MRIEDTDILDVHDRLIDLLNGDLVKLLESTAAHSERIDELETQIRSLKEMLIRHRIN